jgi:hypothetical protein
MRRHFLGTSAVFLVSLCSIGQAYAQNASAPCITLYSSPDFEGRSLKLCQEAELKSAAAWQNPGSIIVHRGNWALTPMLDDEPGKRSKRKKKKAKAQDIIVGPGKYRDLSKTGMRSIVALAPSKEAATVPKPVDLLSLELVFYNICSSPVPDRCLNTQANALLDSPIKQKDPEAWQLAFHKDRTLVVRAKSREVCLGPKTASPKGSKEKLPTQASKTLAVAPCGPDDKQQHWRILKNDKGNLRLEHVQSKKCLARSPDAPLGLAKCSKDSAQQQWMLIKADEPLAQSD